MDKEIKELLENQVNSELQAFYNYLGVSVYYQGRALDYFAKFFHEQALEEFEHAMKIKNYLLDRNVEFNLKDIKASKVSFGNLLEPIELSLSWEKEVTKKITNIYDLALAKKDYLTLEFLNWFLNEQVEEEAQFQNLIDKIKIIGDTNLAFLILDHNQKK